MELFLDLKIKPTKMNNLVITKPTSKLSSQNHQGQSPNVFKITGVICGYRVQEIEDKLIQQSSIFR